MDGVRTRFAGQEFTESKLRYSRFRHVFSKSVRRSEWYDAGPGHGLAVAANPKMIALTIDVPAGGVVQVAKLCTMGRGRMEMSKIKDHEGTVCDVKWNPFNDNVLATASHDATVRVWHIDDMLRIRCLRILRAHSRRVHTVEWHPTVDNAIFSASLDGRLILWDISSDEVIYTIENCNATSISINYDSSEFAITTKSHELSIYNARTGKLNRSTKLIHDGAMTPRVAYYGKQTCSSTERLITTGNSRSTRRQIAIYCSQNLDLLLCTNIDNGSGLLIPVIDPDLNLLYIAAKGDAKIRFYELNDDLPMMAHLGESSSNKAHTAICSLPKRGLNISQCEIMRIFCVDAEQLVIEPLSFIVPRRGDCFQADLFPPTRSPTPSLTFREWHAGLCREPIMFELKDCVLNCTNKPVAFAKQSNNHSKLIIGDLNNDNKFRFLAQVTKPDYREVSSREDRDEILRLEQIKAKLAEEANAKRVLNDENSNGQQTFENDCIRMKDNTTGEFHINTEDHKASPLGSRQANNVGDNSPRTKRLMNARSFSFDDASSDGRSEKIFCNGNEKMDVPTQSDDKTSAKNCSNEEAMVCMIHELEKQLGIYRTRCEQLEKLVQLQQQDIDSLRFEIHWKDGRIEFLQAQLAQLEIPASSSRSS